MSELAGTDMTVADATVDLFEAGDRAYRDGDYERARAILMRLLETEPEHPVAHYRMAQVEHIAGRLNAALPHYRAALDGAPDNPAYWVHYGRLCCDLSDLDAERHAYGRAIALGMHPITVRRNSYQIPILSRRFDELGTAWSIAADALAAARPDDLRTLADWAAHGFVNNVFVQISRRCNLRCTFCGTDAWESNDGYMSVDLFRNVIGKVLDAGKSAVTLVGGQGDPLLNPHAFDLIRFAADAGLAVTLVSNGNPLNERRARLLAESGASTIGISYAGYDRESYESSYRLGKFDIVTRNMKALSDAIAEQARPISFYITGIYSAAVAHLCGFEEFAERTHRFIRDLGVRNCLVGVTSDPHNFAGNVKAGDWQPTPGMFSTQAVDPSRLGLCGGLATMGVFFDGRVTACGCLDANGRLGIGTVTGDASLHDVAASRAYKGFIEAFLRRDVDALPSLCRGCDFPYRKPHHTMTVTL